MTHSPEPWKADIWCDGPVQILDATKKSVVGFINSFDGTAEAIHCLESDLNRIVACVNALAGVPDEAIPTIKPLLDALLTAPVEVTAHDRGKQHLADLLQIWLNRVEDTRRHLRPGKEGET